MERVRTSSNASDLLDSIMAQTSYYATMTHSRESSAASSVSTLHSQRSHGYWASSGSSVSSAAPDSPIMTKSPLGDLLEDPEEGYSFDLPVDGALCMCDGAICPHQRPYCEPEDKITAKRRISSEHSIDSVHSRFARRFPSLSRRWRDSQPTTSSQNVNATPTRSSSLRLPKVRLSLNGTLRHRSAASVTQVPTAAIDITAPPTPIEEDPTDRLEMSRTPLLPPTLQDGRMQSDEAVRSPLQSPRFASAASSVMQSPASPAYGLATPPLSARPSFASFHHQGLHDIPPIDLHNETDPWALKLGHANYHIEPEPYLPTQYTRETCQQLRDHWEEARTAYIRIVTHVSDEYGPYSDTCRLTEQKWNEIDAIWRQNYETANLKAGASGENLIYQPLAETTQHQQRMPSFTNASKFPEVVDIVGPMVQMKKIDHAPSKKPGLLRIFTDPASLIGEKFHFSKR